MMNIRLKLPLERKTGRKVKYGGDGYLFRDIWADETALKQYFKGQVPEFLEIEIILPEEESEEARIRRETDSHLRKNAHLLRMPYERNNVQQ